MKLFDRLSKGNAMPKRLRSIPDPILRLLVVALLLGGAVLLVYGKIPASFKDAQAHIAAATERQAALPVKYAGATACDACHADQAGVKHHGYHRDISCETCHGPAQAHVENPMDVKPPAPRDRRFCPACHAYDPSRPMGFPQINPVTHNPVQPCITCHDPHDPKPPAVPSECAACHAEIERTKAVSPHALLQCTTCHEAPEQHKVMPRQVKATKPTTREFCGTCHGTDSKNETTPKVDLDEHEVKYICWQCHYPHMPEVQ